MSNAFNPQASYVPAGLRKPAAEAIAMGWTAKKSGGRGGWFIQSPKGTEKFYVPITANDPDTLAKKLRAKMSKAYLAEQSAFEPNGPRKMTYAVEELARASAEVIEDGATITPGPVPQIGCKDCDASFTGWDAFAQHQEACKERTAAALAAAQQAEVLPEGSEPDRPSEGQAEDAPENQQESGQAGTITTEEEAVPEAAASHPVKKGGYTWTHVKEPLHRVIYAAIRYNRRWKGETDSEWSKRLAAYMEQENLLDGLTPNVEAVEDGEATRLVAQIRRLLGGEEMESLRAQVTELAGKNEEMGEENERLKSTLRTLSDLAREA